MFLCAGMSIPMQYSILDARNARNVLKTLKNNTPNVESATKNIKM